MAALKEFTVKAATTVRDDYLRTIKNGLIKQGVANPNVTPNSDWFILATALGNELAVIGANAIVKCDQQMPDSATGDDLARIAAVFELFKQPAAGSIGPVVITASATSPIETGRQLTDDAGLRYEVVIGGNYADQDQLTIRAIDTGFETNHAEGDVLQWVTAPPYCSDKVTVGPGGLINGIDDEDDEALRARVLAVLRNPPGAGNWEHVAEVAEESTSSVQKAFVYPALDGPATVHVAVCAAPTDTNKSREVADATMNGTVEPYVIGKLPSHAYVVVTSVTDNDVDVAIGLSLPEAPTANPPGPGGGWTNGTPWPTPDDTTTYRCTVTAVASSTSFTVDATTAPTANVTRISWISPYDWTLYSGLVTSYSGSAGAYTITVDAAFANIAVGCYVWPECQNGQDYVDALLAEFALMGPGEKTTNSYAIARGFRHPTTGGGWNYKLGPALLRAVTDAGDEVFAAQYFHRYDSVAVVTVTGASGSMQPQTPISTAGSPYIFTPRHIGFYRIPT